MILAESSIFWPTITVCFESVTLTPFHSMVNLCAVNSKVFFDLSQQLTSMMYLPGLSGVIVASSLPGAAGGSGAPFEPGGFFLYFQTGWSLGHLPSLGLGIALSVIESP